MTATRTSRSVWIFNHYAVPPDQAGGTRHFDIARELVKRGYEVVIFASSFSHREHREMKLEPDEQWRMETIEGVRFIWIRTAAYQQNDWRRFLNMIDFSRRAATVAGNLPDNDHISAPDIIIGSSVHLFAVKAAMKTARRLKARFIMEVRDVWPQTLVDLGTISSSHPLVLWMRRLENQLYRQAEKVITPLAGAQDYFLEQGFLEQDILYLPQGAPEAAFSTTPLTRKIDEPLVAAYVGAFGPADQVGHLIAAAKNLDATRYKLILAGDGDERAGLMAECRQAGLSHVEFPGPIPKEAVPSLLQSAHICLAHYYDAGARQRFGVGSNKLITYLAAGRPVVLAGKIPGDPVSLSGGGITVDPAKPQAMTTAISDLHRLPAAELVAMGERARQYARDHYSMPKLVDRLEAFWAQ